MKLYTGNYKNCTSDKTLSISRDKGEDANYEGKSYPKLAPPKSFWKEWHDNIGVISEEENNKFYMEKYYETVIKDLDANEVYNDLSEYGEEVILLCYEEPEDFCHRHLVAGWLEMKLGITIKEVEEVNNNINIIEINSRLKEQFQQIIREQENILIKK